MLTPIVTGLSSRARAKRPRLAYHAWHLVLFEDSSFVLFEDKGSGRAAHGHVDAEFWGLVFRVLDLEKSQR